MYIKRSNFKRRLVSTLLAAATALSLTFPAAALALKPPQAIERGTSTYQEALAMAGRSTFAGWCAMSVNHHLMVMGINTAYIACNGNQEWETYSSRTTTSGGYAIRTYPATGYTLKTALEAAALSENTSNLMVCFQEGLTNAGKRYGHTFFIHAIIDGRVYYTESFATTWGDQKETVVPEGTVLCVSINQLCNYYADCVFEGLVQFVDPELDDVPLEALPADPFPFLDVTQYWTLEGITYCYEHQLFSGESPTTFSPDKSMSRAMMVQVLYNLAHPEDADSTEPPAEEEPPSESTPPTEEEPPSESTPPTEEEPPSESTPPIEPEPDSFEDVSDPTAWYYDAVVWAKAAGIVDGISETQFDPNGVLTRAHLVTMLSRYCVQYADVPLENSAELTDFQDAAQVPTWAQSALSWAVGNGILQGTTPVTLSPNTDATRAQTAALMMRLLEGVLSPEEMPDAEESDPAVQPDDESGSREEIVH